jgi:hypothetical protein
MEILNDCRNFVFESKQRELVNYIIQFLKQYNDDNNNDDNNDYLKKDFVYPFMEYLDFVNLYFLSHSNKDNIFDNNIILEFCSLAGDYIYDYFSNYDKKNHNLVHKSLKHYTLSHLRGNKKCAFDIAFCYYKIDDNENAKIYFLECVEYRKEKLFSDKEIGFVYRILGKLTHNLEYHKLATQYNDRESIKILSGIFIKENKTDELFDLSAKIIEFCSDDIFGNLIDYFLYSHDFDSLEKIMENNKNKEKIFNNKEKISCIQTCLEKYFAKHSYLSKYSIEFLSLFGNKLKPDIKHKIIKFIVQNRYEMEAFGLNFYKKNIECVICSTHSVYNINTKCNHDFCFVCFTKLMDKPCSFCRQSMI